MNINFTSHSVTGPLVLQSKVFSFHFHDHTIVHVYIVSKKLKYINDEIVEIMYQNQIIRIRLGILWFMQIVVNKIDCHETINVYDFE